MVEALGVNGVRNLGTGLVIALVVIGVLLILFISNLIARVVILVVVVVLALWVWQQRAAIQHHLTKDKCQLSTTFFGFHVKAPPDVVQACRDHVH